MSLLPRLRAAGLFLAILLAAGASAFAIQRAVRTVRRAQKQRAQPPSMAAMLPGGALLTMESPDFAGLLHAWTASRESAAWVHSANYAVFSNSRLFGRLADAQAEFASAATLDEAGTSFLTEVAGRESIFAWYDVGKLEFLYITRMTPARAAQTQLLQARSRFLRREAGSSVFYIRTGGAKDDGAQRTVAFATAGDLLLLATREDLLANALQLIDHTNSVQASLSQESVAQEPWYGEALAAAKPSGAAAAPDLHMVLNLERIVPLPYFRSYWVQQNITHMGRYRCAVADLFREPSIAGHGSQFREERTLLLKSAPASPVDATADLGALAGLVPPETGVFRAFSSSDSQEAVNLVEEKLLGGADTVSPRATEAPDPSLEPAAEGSASDFETRIDTSAPKPESASTKALAQTLDTAGLNAVLTLESAMEPEKAESTLAVPIQSAVVLRTARTVDPAAFRQALQQALRGSLTAANLGTELRPLPGSAAPTWSLSGPKPLFVAFAGSVCVLSNDEPLLAKILARANASPAPAPRFTSSATFMGAFHHAGQRLPYARLTSLIDAPGRPLSTPNSAELDHPAPPPFFSGNLRSLSDAFAALQSEHIVIWRDGEIERQTVLYQWQP